MQKVLVSSCLLGEPVRYDGSAATCRHPVLVRWQEEGRIVPCCPELEGGLGTPRSPVELLGGAGEAVLGGVSKAIGRDGEDVTSAFIAGARATLALCQHLGIRLAVLKERSPSCGSTRIHDGTFAGRLLPGQGVTAALLRQHGIQVLSEGQWEQAREALFRLEAPGTVMPAVPAHRIDHPEE